MFMFSCERLAHFTGVALELTPNFDFKRKTPPPGLQLGNLVGKVVGLRRGLLQVLALAVAISSNAAM